MSRVTVREAVPADRAAIHSIVQRAFGRLHEADLVARLVAANAVTLELVADEDGRMVGHILFSRLMVENGETAFEAVSLAPLSVDPDYQGRGIGSALVLRGHEILKERGEKLSVVLGDPDYYRRFGYSHAAAEKFGSDYQGDALQALAWGEAPTTGELDYADAFTDS
jgi:putative acetyltransferase